MTYTAYREILCRALLAQPKAKRRETLRYIREQHKQPCPDEFERGRPSDRVRAAKAALRETAERLHELNELAKILFERLCKWQAGDDACVYEACMAQIRLYNAAASAARAMNRRNWALATESASHNQRFWKLA